VGASVQAGSFSKAVAAASKLQGWIGATVEVLAPGQEVHVGVLTAVHANRLVIVMKLKPSGKTWSGDLSRISLVTVKAP
jgi:hypothetical protein